MIARIKQKLNSQCGATILIAMMFLLLCTMVGSVVLTSASANVNKTKGRETGQEDYLALSSAVRFIEDTIDGKTCEGVEQNIVYGCAGNPNLVAGDVVHKDTPSWEKNMTIPDREDAQFQMYMETVADAFLKQSAQYHKKTVGSSQQTTNFVIRGEGMKAVNVTMVMDSQYRQTYTLSVADSSYQAILVIGANVVSGETSETKTESHKVYVTDDKGKATIESRSFNIMTYKYTTKVTWNKSTLAKGNIE